MLKPKCARKRIIKYAQRIESKVLKRYLYTHVHCSITHNSQCVEGTTDEWADKLNGIHNGILFGPKKESLSHATTWMKLKNIMLTEVSQS